MLKKRRLTAVMAALLSISLGMRRPAESGGRPKAPASGDKSPAQADPKFSITAIDFRYGDPPPTSSPGIDMINEKFNVDYKPVLYRTPLLMKRSTLYSHQVRFRI